MRGRVALTGVLGALALAVGATGAAAGDDVPFVDWTTLLPSVSNQYTPSREKDCVDGAAGCIDATIAEMYRRFNTVVPPCDHRAVFSITYIRVTESIRDALHAGFYQEPTFLQHEDKVFARMYFAAWDNAQAGRRELVAPAWRVAYDAAKARDVSGLGDLLLSMNAHINRDMPFMLAALGLTMPDGRTRKVDHDRGNALLSKLYQPVIAEIARRFDPKADDVNAGSGDEAFAVAVLQSWREGVWRNAERLVLAPTQQARQEVADDIEQSALATGNAIRQATKVDAAGAKARDAWCATHGGQDPSAGVAPARPGAATLRDRAAPLRLARSGSVAIALRCPRNVTGCRGTLSLGASPARQAQTARPRAKVRFSLAAGSSDVVRVWLDEASASRIRRAGSGRALLTIARKGIAGRRALARWTVTIRS